MSGNPDEEVDPYRYIYDHVQINEALGHYISGNSRLSDIESITVEPMDVRNMGVLDLPALSIFTATNIRSDNTSTELAGYVTNEEGGEIGEWYETTFDLTTQLDIWCAAQSGNNPTKIGTRLELELLRFDTNNNDGFIPNPEEEGDYITNVDNFTVMSGNRVDFSTPANASEEPPIKRWMMEIDISFHYLINTVDLYGPKGYVTTINYPEYGDFTNSPRPEIEIQADPSLPDSG